MRHRSGLLATCVGIVWVASAAGTSAGFTTPTTTTSPVIVLPTTTLRPSFTTTTSTTTTTTTSPVIVIPTTARSTTTTSPVIVIPSTTTTVPPTVVPTGPPNIAISTTSDAPDVAAELPEDFPDVSVRAIEVTQGIQDLESRMPLVAGRKTVVRVHVAAYDAGAGGSADVHIDGALLVERAGVEEVLYPMNGPIVPGLDRTNLDSALNFELDAAHIAAGDVTLTAEVWAIAFEQSDEPDPANNLMSQHVEFHTAEVPTVMLMALDDGAGPGPAVGDVNSALLPFAVLVYQDLLDYMPIAAVDVQFYPVPVLPGAEAVEPGLWDLGLDADVDDTANTRRNEPNTRMNGIAAAGGYLGESTVIGLIDDAVPTDVYSGWAKFEVSWAQANPGTPAHEVGHNQGLAHVGCVDNDGDGLGDEESGGAVDHTHPTGLPPQCSLAPIDPEGFFGYTTYHDPATIYSNDPGHPQAAFPFMSYADPGWNDPYDWCLLLTSFGVPCSPAGLGLPAHPDPFTVIDCVPEPVGEFGMELCLAQDTADPLPAPAPTIDHLTNDVGMETLTIQVEGTTFEYPTDTEGWAYVSTTLLGDGSGGAIVLARSAAPDAASMGRQFVASGGDQVLRVVDAEGRILATVPVVTAEPGGGDVAGHAWPSHDGNQGADTGAPFAALSPVPLVEGAVAVEFVVEGVVVDSIPVAAAPPEIGAVSVADGRRRGPRVLGARRQRRPGGDDVHGPLERRRRDLDPRRRRRRRHRAPHPGVGAAPRRRPDPGRGDRQRRSPDRDRGQRGLRRTVEGAVDRDRRRAAGSRPTRRLVRAPRGRRRPGGRRRGHHVDARRCGGRPRWCVRGRRRPRRRPRRRRPHDLRHRHRRRRQPGRPPTSPSRSSRSGFRRSRRRR